MYAACKIEENHVSAEEIGKGIKQDHHVILKYEMAVLQATSLCLYISHVLFSPRSSVHIGLTLFAEFGI